MTVTVDELRRSIGVSPSVAETMLKCEANVLASDGLLLRTCSHGVRHPVGHLHRNDVFDVRPEEDRKAARDRHGRSPGASGLLL